MTSEKVKIPALALDGQNWKIFRVKLIEAAATQHVLGLLAGWEVEPDNNESDEWDNWFGYDAIAKFLIYPTLPLELLRPIRKLRTVHEMFEFLAHHFHDHNPIERDAQMNKAKTCANEEVNNGQVGTVHVHTEDTYQTFGPAGIAAESPENPQRSGDGQVTNNGSENATHQVETMQKRWQKFAGTCYRCGEVGHRARDCRLLNDMPKCSAKGQTTTDGQKWTRRCKKRDNSTTKVDETALLGGEPAKRAPEVDETMRSNPQRLMQAQTIEENQRSKNATKDIPGTHGLPLEGEWIVCVSGEASCEMGTSESRSVDDEVEAFVQMPTKSSQQLAGVDGDTGRKVEPTDTTNVPEALVTASNNLENLDCGDIPHMYLRSMNWCAGDPNGLGSQMDELSCEADVSTGQVDVLRGWTETLSMSDSPETAGISCGDNLGMYLGAGGAKCSAEVTEGFGSHMDPSSARTGVLSVGTDVNMTVNEAETISMRPVQLKLPKPPTGGKNGHADETDGSRNHPSMSSTHMDGYTIGNMMETTTNVQEIVSMCPIVSKQPNPPTKGANGCANKSDGCGNPADTSSARMDVHSTGDDAKMAADEAENIRTLQNEPKMSNLPAGDAKCGGDVMDGVGSHADVSNWYRDTPSIEMHAKLPTNPAKIVRTSQNQQNSPIKATKWTPDEPNRCGSRSDVSSGCMDMHSAGDVAKTAVNKAETVSRDLIEPKSPDPPTRGASGSANKSDGLRGHADTSTGQTDAPCIETDVDTSENASRNVRNHQNSPKTKNLPMEAARRHSNESNACRDQTDVSSRRTDTHCVGIEMETAETDAKNIRMPRNLSKMQNSPYATEITTCKRATQWRKISVNNGGVYVPLDVPIETSS